MKEHGANKVGWLIVKKIGKKSFAWFGIRKIANLIFLDSLIECADMCNSLHRELARNESEDGQHGFKRSREDWPCGFSDKFKEMALNAIPIEPIEVKKVKCPTCKAVHTFKYMPERYVKGSGCFLAGWIHEKYTGPCNHFAYTRRESIVFYNFVSIEIPRRKK